MVLRIGSPMSRWFVRPMMFDDMDEQWPGMTTNEGLDIYEENDNVVVKASVPGIPADKVDVTFEDGVLRIQAHYEESEEEKKKKQAVYKMNRVTSFEYTTTLPRPVDANSINAKVENGVVMITARIAEAAKPKKIPVTASK